MKTSFFKIVGGFSLAMATIALIIAIIVGFSAGSKFLGSADEDVKQPKISFGDFYESRKDESLGEKVKVNPSSNESSKEDDEYFKKLAPLLASISKSLNEFAATTKQGSVNEDGLEDYLVESTSMIGREDYLEFLEELDDAADDLNDEADNIAKLKPSDKRYINWSEDFLPWFVDSYVSSYSKELQRINEEKAQDLMDKSDSIATAGIAGSAFMIFVFFTLIVLLVQIEKNTRVNIN